MSEPKRYTGKVEGLLLGSPHWEHPEGEWVKWEDYASLKAEVERLTKLLGMCESIDNSIDRWIESKRNTTKDGKQP
jgi:hypothetical protein